MSLQQLHWYGWIALAIGATAFLNVFTDAVRYVVQRDAEPPRFGFEVVLLVVVLYMVTP